MKSLLSKLLLVVFPILATPYVTFSQTDTINISKNELQIQYLKEGLHQYLVYFENPKKQRLGGMSIWNRHVTFKKQNEVETIEIKQHWYLSDTLFNRYVYSISNKKNFAPIYHYTKSSRGTEAFDFYKDKISGADTVLNNSKNDFAVMLTAPTLNWELDLEVFSTLPFKRVGQKFYINFYHPGGRSEPKYYKYDIVGSEKLNGVEGGSFDCWKMKIDYDKDSWAIFWISKKSKEVIKMQEYFRGGYRYKVKLATVIPLTQL
ncbi:DUF3108 domain-containing protein [Chryseosolibacter indicus]|uniref:DUF3108 domain-containing protein n=1 Tax=Chryseosolibacter indicus TaxID=2782351 RepID=A0ABS5VS80_9BACT|nr:hypothetical protein [Chryseosolibacter indicus]MBT1703624.1 hypothetical protein [Chryseosolibacter indicus]